MFILHTNKAYIIAYKQLACRRILKVPDDFMFFLRTIGLLRGLATTLEAKVPYLELLYLYARRALLREQLGLPPVGPPALTRTAARAHA
mmetsp:Transcript_22244/g.51738  ORF Transcript_22244/g.51738 Transcript_22244/m.51738 type:complete len:89 (+) Transcript_22244:187-453(+)